MRRIIAILVCMAAAILNVGLPVFAQDAPEEFVGRSGAQFTLDGRPYYFAGANTYDLFTFGDGNPTTGYEPFYQCLIAASAIQRRRRGTHFLSNLDPISLAFPINRGGHEWRDTPTQVGTPDDLDATLREIRRLNAAAVLVVAPNLSENYLRELESSGALVVAFEGPARRDPRRFATGMLAVIASGLGGRFFDELRDRQSLAYTVQAYASERALAGVFISYIATSPDREDVARAGLLRRPRRRPARCCGAGRARRGSRCSAWRGRGWRAGPPPAPRAAPAPGGPRARGTPHRRSAPARS